MQTSASPEAPPPLAHFPRAIFSRVMGTCGLALAWQRGGEAISAPPTGLFVTLRRAIGASE